MFWLETVKDIPYSEPGNLSPGRRVINSLLLLGPQARECLGNPREARGNWKKIRKSMGTCHNQWIFGSILIDFNELAQKLRFPFSGPQDPSYINNDWVHFGCPVLWSSRNCTSWCLFTRRYVVWFISVSNIPKHLMNYSPAV